MISPSAPLSCGSSASSVIGTKTPTLFGNVPLALDSVIKDSVGLDSAAVINVIGQDSATYVVCNRLTLPVGGSMTIKGGLDSVSVALNTLSDSLAGITVTNTCSNDSCVSLSAPLGCGDTLVDTVLLYQRTNAGQFSIELSSISDITTATAKKLAAVKKLGAVTSSSSVGLTFFMNNCNADTTVTLNVGQPTTVQVGGGIYSLVITVEQTLNTVGSIGNPSAVFKFRNVCPK